MTDAHTPVEPAKPKHVIRPIRIQRFHDDGRVETFYPRTCPACGAQSDPYGNLPCACGSAAG